MIGRVTHQTQVAATQRNLQSTAANLARLQEQGASQSKLNRPSDDPVAAADALQVRSQIAARDQYARNIDDGNAWLATIDSALSTSLDLLNRARDLVVQGANDTNSPVSREALAVEIEAIRDELFSQANTTYLGRSVFAGTSDTAAYTAGTWDHSGTPTAEVTRRTGADTTIRVDADGSKAFGAGATSVFAALDDIATTLRAGTNVAAGIDELDSHLRNVTSTLAEVGTRHAQLLRAENDALDQEVALETRRSSIEDVDLAELLLELEVQRTSYQASLGIASQTLPISLMDYLR